MDFFENGFYKQNYDDRNLFAIFTAFIAPVWIFIGVFISYSKDMKELAVLSIFTAVITMASFAGWQYKNRKEYKLLEKDKK